ncbi:MAG: outer rane efflux protein [Myxococcales bacterium]|nr:outer rane efflux protein [Myxococcales bacterium]
MNERFVPCRLLLTGAVSAALGGSPAAAGPVYQDDPALRDYVARARRMNRELAARSIEIAKRDSDRAAVRAGYLPKLDLDVRYTRTFGNELDLGKLVNPAYEGLNQIVGDNRFPTDLHLVIPLRLDARLRLTQPLYAPAITAGDHLAEAGIASSVAERAVTERDIGASVRSVYIQHARAGLVVDLLRRSRPLFVEALRVSRLLETNDMATGDAVPRAKAELAAFDQRIRDVERQERFAARQLDLLVDTEIDAPVPVPPTLAVPPLPVATSSKLVANARAVRRELAVVSAGDAAHAAEREVVRARYLPSLGVAVDYGFLTNDAPGFDNDYVAVSIVASWNLFSGGADHARIRSAELERAALAVRRGQLEDRIELEVLQAWTDADDARQAIASSEERIASAGVAYNIVAIEYAAGAVPQIDLIAARTTLLQAETDRIVAVTDLWLHLVELDRVAETQEDR